MEKNVRTRIVIADHDAIFRHGLQHLLEKEPDMEVVGDTGNGRATFHQIRQLSPDIVLSSINIYDLHNINQTRQIIFGLPHLKVISLISDFNNLFIPGILRSAGASGYLLKNCSFKDIMTAIHTVKKNEFHLGTEIENFIFEAEVIKSSNNVDMTCNTEAPEFVGSDEKVILELQKIFINKAPRLLESLKKAIDTDDAVLAGDQACSLKIASTVIGAYSVREKASRIEVTARHSNLDNIRPFYEDLENTFKNKIRELKVKQCQNILE